MGGTNDVLKRHVKNGDCNERLDQRREPRGAGGETDGTSDQRDRMRDRKCCNNQRECSQAPQGDDQTEQEQEVVWSVEDVQKAKLDEPPSGLEPTRIQWYTPWIACELVCPDHIIRQLESESGGHLCSQVIKARSNREFGMLGSDRVLQQHIKQNLVPDQVLGIGGSRCDDMRERPLKGCEGIV